MELLFRGKSFEHLFISEAISREIIVSQPQVDVGYDFLIEHNREYNRVQVKSCQMQVKRADGRIGYQVPLKRKLKNQHKKYDKTICDLISIYLPQEKVWYNIPVEEIKKFTIILYPYDENCTFTGYKNNWHILKNNK